MKTCYLIIILALISCNQGKPKEKEFSFCECFEIEMKIQSETEGGDQKLAKELAEKKEKHCNHLQSLPTKEFYENAKECK